MATTEFADDIVAKHVFGALAFGDIWPQLRPECAAIQITIHESEKYAESRIFNEWRCHTDGLQMLGHAPLPYLYFDSKILIQESSIRMELNQFKDRWIEAIFFKLNPMEMKII